MNVLKDKTAYLSAPIENDTANFDWRTEPKKILKERFGINVFDPFADPKQSKATELHEAKKRKDYAKIVEIVKVFVRNDLAKLDRADFLIAYILQGIPTVGVPHEIINSNNSKKPTLLVTNSGDISNIPLWYFGFIPTEFMFESWEKLYDYLDEVNKGKHRNNNRWSFVYSDVTLS